MSDIAFAQFLAGRLHCIGDRGEDGAAVYVFMPIRSDTFPARVHQRRVSPVRRVYLEEADDRDGTERLSLEARASLVRMERGKRPRLVW